MGEYLSVGSTHARTHARTHGRYLCNSEKESGSCGIGRGAGWPVLFHGYVCTGAKKEKVNDLI